MQNKTRNYLFFCLLLGCALLFYWVDFLKSYQLTFSFNEIVFLTISVKKNLIDFMVLIIVGTVIAIININRYSRSVIIILVGVIILCSISLINKATNINIVESYMLLFYLFTFILSILAGITGLLTNQYLKYLLNKSDFPIIQFVFCGLSLVIGIVFTFPILGVVISIIYSLIIILLSVIFQGICYSLGWLLSWFVKTLFFNFNRGLSWVFD